MFAIITVALISGAVADRAKFGTWALFVVLWVTIVYLPVAHWVFASTRATAAGSPTDSALDFAGGTAVHINAGAAALALAIVVGKRTGWRREQMRPHNLPFVVLGAGLLWFGWFGFNSGSAVSAGRLAAARSSTLRSRPRRRSWAGCSWRSCETSTPPHSAPHPVPLPAWSRSRPHVRQ